MDSAGDITFGQLTGMCRWRVLRSVSWPGSTFSIPFVQLTGERRWYYFRSVNCGVPLIFLSVSWPGCAADITSQTDGLHRVSLYYTRRTPKTCQTIYDNFPHMWYYVECDMLSSPTDILSAYQIVWPLSFVIQK